MSFDLPTFLGQSPLNTFDAAFGITETRDQLLNLPGNSPSASQNWVTNPVGTPSPTGRTIQGTTLTIDPLPGHNPSKPFLSALLVRNGPCCWLTWLALRKTRLMGLGGRRGARPAMTVARIAERSRCANTPSPGC
jgi:hypothetical protein